MMMPLPSLCDPVRVRLPYEMLSRTMIRKPLCDMFPVRFSGWNTEIPEYGPLRALS